MLNILTGKVLPPAPLELALGRQMTFKMTTDSNVNSEGFEFVYDLRGNDWYIADVECKVGCSKITVLSYWSTTLMESRIYPGCPWTAEMIGLS